MIKFNILKRFLNKFKINKDIINKFYNIKIKIPYR